MTIGTIVSAQSRNLLFVTADDAPRSARARVNLGLALEASPARIDPIFEIDGLVRPAVVAANGLIATPALLDQRRGGIPRAMYGDLANVDSTRDFLMARRIPVLTDHRATGWMVTG